MKENRNTIDDLLNGALNNLYIASNSRKKTKYTLADALKHKHLGDERTKVIIDTFSFLSKSPLQNNDYYKYFIAYANNGIKLNTGYFKHDLDKLNGYYKKFDDDKLNVFNVRKYNEYVLYISLKLFGCYTLADDEVFNVTTTDSREYNPLSSIPSVLRGELPFKVKEYDIKKAFPTFIDIELNTDHRHTAYDVINKKNFASALNSHNESNYSLTDARNTLKKVYGDKTNEVLTDKRYNEHGKVFKDFTKYEHDYIQTFVKSNQLECFARLHDGVFVLDRVEVENINFDKVEFAIKKCIKPKVINNKTLFYSFDYSGKVILTPTSISDFLEQEKFIRITSADDKVQLLKNNNNVIDYFNHKTDTVSFLENKIIEIDKTLVKDAIARHNTSTIAQSFSLLKTKELNYYKDTKNSFGLPFKNGFIHFDNLDKFELKNKSYDEVNGFFAKHDVQEKTFIYTDEIGDFERFICRVASGIKEFNPNSSEFISLCSIIGYLGTNYKDPSFTKAIVFTDDGANSQDRNGGRGKTAVIKALTKFVNCIIKGGKEFDPSYNHCFAELKSAIVLYAIDDVPAGHDFNANYTAITGEISPQPKGGTAFNIPFSDTPKFVYTTNYIFRLNKSDSSTVRRFTEFKFKPYYSIDLTPKDEFGCLFFDDWNSKEWNKFYSFVFRCVYLFKTTGLNEQDYDKEQDNYKATFNDINEVAMETILKVLTKRKEKFNATDIMREYHKLDYYLNKEGFINSKNANRLVGVFIDANNWLHGYKFKPRDKKWTFEG